MKVLLVEDDVIQSDLCRNWLQGRGHEVHACRSAVEAVRWLEGHAFDAVVLDALLPDLSGQDVLAWIRRRGLSTPVLFATSCGDEFEIAATLELGADDYVVKPLRRLEFVARVEVLGRRAARRAA